MKIFKTEESEGKEWALKLTQDRDKVILEAVDARSGEYLKNILIISDAGVYLSKNADPSYWKGYKKIEGLFDFNGKITLLKD